MFLLISGRHVGAHVDGHQHGVPVQISINLGKTFLRISRLRKIAVIWILARVFAYFAVFLFPDSGLYLLNGFYFYLDMAWHWKPAIVYWTFSAKLVCFQWQLLWHQIRHVTRWQSSGTNTPWHKVLRRWCWTVKLKHWHRMNIRKLWQCCHASKEKMYWNLEQALGKDNNMLMVTSTITPADDLVWRSCNKMICLMVWFDLYTKFALYFQTSLGNWYHFCCGGIFLY